MKQIPPENTAQDGPGAPTGQVPTIALVGRPNVGKSTLFNRLTRTRRALVADVPGLTRDRKEALASYEGYRFRVVDTGGMPFGDGDVFSADVRRQIFAALADADGVWLIVDGVDGLNPFDATLFEELRRRGKSVRVLVNKADHPNRDAGMAAFYELGTADVYPVSALHGRGISDLLADAARELPLRSPDEAAEGRPDAIRVAFLGRPNVGKSSLINCILGDARMIVSDVPGTTREAVDVTCELEGQAYVLIDTAGIRRRARTKEYLEKIGVLSSLEALRRADVGVLVLDAGEDVSDQDARLGGYVQDSRRAAVIAANKWDLLGGRRAAEQAREEDIAHRLRFLDFAPCVHTSALEGEGIPRLFRAIRAAYGEYTRKIQTADLNKVVERLTQRHAPPSQGRRATKLYYGTQTGTRPPAFSVFTNRPEQIDAAYERFVENQLRHHFGLEGTPLKLAFRGRDEARKGSASGHTRGVTPADAVPRSGATGGAVAGKTRRASRGRNDGEPAAAPRGARAAGAVPRSGAVGGAAAGKPRGRDDGELAPVQRRARAAAKPTAPKRGADARKGAAPKRAASPRKGAAPKRGAGPRKGGSPKGGTSRNRRG